MNNIGKLRDMVERATPLPWTAEFLGGRELADQGILAGVESVSSPFCRSSHEDDEGLAVAAVNILAALLAVAEAAELLRSLQKRGARDSNEHAIIASAADRLDRAIAKLEGSKE